METPHKSRRTTKLTGDRAARKREQDRQAQRSAREKTKKLIAHLESRIETLTRFHNSGNVQELINELETQRKANEALRTTLRSIERAINTGLSEANTVLKNSSPPKKEINNNRSTSPDGQNSEHPAANGGIPEISQQPSLVGPSQHHIPQQSVSPPFDEPAIIDKFSPNGTFGGLHDGLSLAAKTPDDVHVPFNSTLHSFPLDIPMPIQALVQSTESPCDCCKQLLYMNEMLGRFALSSIQNMADQRVRDADIAIRAVLHGWDAVSHLYQLDPIWAMLRTADEGVWRACGAVERLSILRIVSLMLRYLSDPSESNLRHLPKFMRQRPSQHRIIHKPLIDFVVWPGLRERLILFPHQHCSEKFWSMFWTCFRISWPYHLHDTFTQQGPTSLYRFSDTFNKYFFDLESWCMTPEFFREYPDLEADVNMVPNSAGSTPCAVDGELAMGNSGLGHGGVSRLNPIAANIFTPFPITDWSTSRNHFF
ncbi:bZIP transcription factor [Aspergillus lucknowensis]|uniref:BZIP transcription factor n=1 Tax=Aspergillus lucknowensis TaxID=176173 RepID=A0ABR4LX28_9EURO